MGYRYGGPAESVLNYTAHLKNETHTILRQNTENAVNFLSLRTMIAKSHQRLETNCQRNDIALAIGRNTALLFVRRTKMTEITRIDVFDRQNDQDVRCVELMVNHCAITNKSA